jgi:hypothetical protein
MNIEIIGCIFAWALPEVMQAYTPDLEQMARGKKKPRNR